MADYQLTPYAVTVYPSRDKESPRKMGRIDPAKPGVSVLDAITNTFVVLAKEANPRRRSDDRDRQLDVRSVRRGKNQVEVNCSLGVGGYTSLLKLESLGVPATRGYQDTEWFDLRVVFAASPTARAGVLLVEGVGNFGIVTHVSNLIKQGIHANIDNVTVSIAPIQDAEAWGETFAALVVDALEFRSLVRTGDVADDAQSGGRPVPLKKIVKISRRGGLGAYRSILGKKVKQVADMYGVGKDIDDQTWAVATLSGPGNRKRKINVEENKVSSISFPVERGSPLRPPTTNEFYTTAQRIVADVKEGVGLGSLTVGAIADADARTIETIDTLDWMVPDEVASDEGGN